MDSADERRVAILLDRCVDVTGWVYNHQKVGYAIEYEWDGRASHYIPDFIVRASIGGVEHNIILEVKGRFEDRDKAKALRGYTYAQQLTIGDKRPWHYVLLMESPSNKRQDITWWEKRSATEIEDLLRHHENLALFPGLHTVKTEVTVVPGVSADEEYRVAWPVYDLVAAAGSFSPSQTPEPLGWMRMAPDATCDRRCFVARMQGSSMQPHIPDGAWVLFRRWEFVPPPRALDGRRVLVELRDATDPDSGGRYTVKRWRVAAIDADGAVERIELRPDNRACATLSITGVDGDVRVIAEVVRVVG